MAAPAIADSALSQNLNWSQWEQARSYYDAGKWNEALASFQQEADFENPNYYYNVGLVYFRLGRLGASLAHLEKANRLAPHDAGVRHNLQTVRGTLTRTLGSRELDPASNWLETMADRVPLDEARGALGLIVLLLALLWIRAYWKSRNLLHTFFHPASILGLIALTMSGGIFAARQISNAQPPAMTLERISIRSGPGEHFLELGAVEAGIKLRYLGVSAHQSGSTPPILWRQVRYTHDAIGWVKASSLLLL